MRTPATVLLGLAFTASAANAQQPVRLDVHADTLAKAMAGLSPATKAAASAYVTGPDAAARRSAAEVPDRSRNR